MAPKGKGKAKAASKQSASTAPKSTTLDVPQPFARPSEKLQPFLSKLNKKHVYITHIDAHPREHKRNIFMIPIVLNTLVLVAICWRIYTIGPWYMKLCLSLMGHVNEMTIDKSQYTTTELGQEALRRTATFLVDFFIYVFIWPWPRDFFAGQTNSNPIVWRMSVGLRDKEVIVRRSRRWDTQIGNVVGQDTAGANLFAIHARAAVSPTWMFQKTAYLMMNKEWDLDWWLMIKATKMVDKKTLDLEDFTTAIYVHSPEYGWVVFEPIDKSVDAKEELGRKKIVAFKDELTAIGKESLFFRWIELIQYESTQPGGFTPERQAIAMQKAKEMFEAQGVDFEKFWTKIGGMEGMPGLDSSSS